ncbi:MAG: hypothetical protein MJ225_03575 [Bacilli bacterium]|nr:hypothetical protein [Bacilli bacterium]
MKKRFLSILPITLLALTGCKNSNTPIDYLKDSDFDGLYDYLDPTSLDNRSGFKVDGYSQHIHSNEIIVPIDYRNFLQDNTKYNKEIALMCSIVESYSYVDNANNYWSIVRSEYKNKDSEVNKCLVQFGFSNVEHITVNINSDFFDACGLFLGTHIFRDDELKLHQIVMCSIEGYPERSNWNSNFDIGDDSEGYYESTGEHPEWTNKKHHKGFDVTANRAYTILKQFLNEHKQDGIEEQTVLVTGHSRGGSISNLLGKKLKDDNIRSFVYTFSAPNTTTEDDDTILSKYDNIFNIFSVNDYIPRFPFAHMNFGRYGTDVGYDLVKHNDIYQAVFNCDFHGNAPEVLDKIDQIASQVLKGREEIYQFDEFDAYSENYVLCSSYEEATQTLEELNTDVELVELDKFVKLEIAANIDSETSDLYPYRVQYVSKPAAFLAFAGKLMATLTSEIEPLQKASLIITYVTAGLKFISKYLDEIVELGGVPLDIDRFAYPHMNYTSVAGALATELD